MASDPPPMPFFVREKEFLKLYGFGTSQIEEAQAPPFPLALPKAASWCPSGIALAMVDPVQGPRVAVFESETGSKLSGASLLDLPKAPKNAFTFMWSPMGSALVTIAPGGKNLQESNVHVWRRAGADGPGAGAGQGGEYELQASYCHPKLEKDKKVLQWTNDENLCARLTPEGKIILYDGANLGEDHLMELAVQNVAGFEFAPMTASETCFARLALFVADQRDDLQRVVGPAEVSILELSVDENGIHSSPCAKMSVTCGQVADLLWNNMGSCLIAHCQTEVDETGQSYYGGSRLAFMSRAGEVKKDLTDEECQGGCVQAVSWSPTRDEFILISGFQPAKATLYVWDEKAKKVSSKKTLLDKAHRNTIRYNSFGSLVCLAGFGNLAGGVDFFGRDEDEYVHVASCTANCTVSAEWAPDGRHFLTAVLAPRMRVDNAINVWSGLSGSKVCTTPFEELFDVQWRPLPDSKYTDVTKEEIVAASKEDAKNVVEAGAQQKQAYRPPKARGETQNTVAQMMRGEVAAPEDDRRTRKTRQQRPKDEEAAGQDDSKEDGQTDSPPSRPPPPEAPPPPAARAQQAQAQQQAQQAQQQVQQAQQQAQQREAQAREAQRMREMQNAAKAANAAQLDRQRQLQEAQEAAQEQIVRDMLNLQRSAGYGGGADAAAALRLQAAHNAAQAKAMVQQRQQQQQREQALLLGASTQQELARRMQLYEQAQQAQNGMQLLEENAARLQEQRQRQQHEAKKLAQAQQMAAAGHQRQQQQQQQQMQSMGASAHGQKQACPATGWQYIDPKNQIQGPFSLLEMQQWYHMNYFRPELKMRCSEQDDFVPFSELFPHPMVPFQSYPKRVPSGGRR